MKWAACWSSRMFCSRHFLTSTTRSRVCLNCLIPIMMPDRDRTSRLTPTSPMTFQAHGIRPLITQALCQDRGNCGSLLKEVRQVQWQTQASAQDRTSVGGLEQPAPYYQVTMSKVTMSLCPRPQVHNHQNHGWHGHLSEGASTPPVHISWAGQVYHCHQGE